MNQTKTSVRLFRRRAVFGVMLYALSALAAVWHPAAGLAVDPLRGSGHELHFHRNYKLALTLC